MNKSSIFVVAVAALAIGFGLSWLFVGKRTLELEDGVWFGEQARALPDFELTDDANRPFTRRQLEGKWSLLFFGYTHCPDVCPTTLQTLGAMMNAIDDADVAGAVQVVFVSVDPARDTPAQLASYVTYFNPDFIGATAPLDRLATLTRALGIAHQLRNESENGGGYDVDHSAAIVLINPEAEFAGLFSAPHDALAMARDMTRIVEHN